MKRIPIPEEVKQKCVEMLEAGSSPIYIYENYYRGKSNMNYDTFNRALRKWKHRINGTDTIKDTVKDDKHKDDTSTDDIPHIKSVEYKSDGSATFEGIIELMEGDPITPEIIMEAHNLDSEKWETVSYKSNFWKTQAKGGATLNLFQSKITVKPKTRREITFEDIDRYFDGKDYSKDKLPIECLNYDPEGEILEINLADPHIGLLSYRKETGEDFDLKIIKKRYFMCINDIVKRCKYKKLKKVVFVNLGDVLHADNNNQTTTNGTFQQTDGRLEKITECAEDMLIDSISMLVKLAPVEVVYICGNHDRLTGYMLIRSVMNAMRNDSNVTFDIAPNPIKHKIFGCTLVVFHHGDLPKKNTNDLPINFARGAISQTRFTEVHCGHYHSEEVKTIGGVKVKYLPTIASSSYWENQQGYKSDRAMVCYLWNEKTGLRETWYTMI